MSYHPRIETSEFASFLTTRSRNSELWFANNKPLEDAVLGYTAKYATVHNVTLYAVAIEGSHYQSTADFPSENRANYMRDLNSNIARAVPRYTPEHDGGTFWGRRYSQEFLPDDEDIENWFFYTVLQPVQDGLVEKISDYPGYNCFHDAVYGIERKFKVMRWGEYNSAKRFNKRISMNDFIDVYTLSYERLPGYESLTQFEYAQLMHQKLEARRVEIVKKRYAAGRGFLGRSGLKSIKTGSRPLNTKTSTINSRRPRILSICSVRREACKEWYFKCYARYKECSIEYRRGNAQVEFPKGMYPPPIPPHPISLAA